MKIWHHLEQSALYQKARQIFAYASFGSEVETYTMIESSRRLGKRVCLPRVNTGTADPQAERTMEFREISMPHTVERSRFGIYEPAFWEQICTPEEDTLILVPGLAFDYAGGRIGFGKGFYDRYLSRFRQGIRMGVCFEFQVTEKQLPCGEMDERMQYLLLPGGLYSIQERKIL